MTDLRTLPGGENEDDDIDFAIDWRRDALEREVKRLQEALSAMEKVARQRQAWQEEGLLREAKAQRDRTTLIALALATGDQRDGIGDSIPQEVWDDLHERGLVQTNRDIVDDAYTNTTTEGLRVLVAAVSAEEPPSRCPRCEGYEASYHTFEGECSQTRPPEEPA